MPKLSQQVSSFLNSSRCWVGTDPILWPKIFSHRGTNQRRILQNEFKAVHLRPRDHGVRIYMLYECTYTYIHITYIHINTYYIHTCSFIFTCCRTHRGLISGLHGFQLNHFSVSSCQLLFLALSVSIVSTSKFWNKYPASSLEQQLECDFFCVNMTMLQATYNEHQISLDTLFHMNIKLWMCRFMRTCFVWTTNRETLFHI